MTTMEQREKEIFEKYKNLSLQGKVAVLAQTFGKKSGTIQSTPCFGKWRGSSDVVIRFDDGTSLFVGITLTPKAKTVSWRTEYIDGLLTQYNPEIIAEKKAYALPILLEREKLDAAVAKEKGLPPYKVLTVEMQTDDYSLGWYYVTLEINGKIHPHRETGLDYAISKGNLQAAPSRPYFISGATDPSNVDYVFDNVGFSTKDNLYTTIMSADALDRALQAQKERLAESETPKTVQTPPRRGPHL